MTKNNSKSKELKKVKEGFFSFIPLLKDLIFLIVDIFVYFFIFLSDCVKFLFGDIFLELKDVCEYIHGEYKKSPLDGIIITTICLLIFIFSMIIGVILLKFLYKGGITIFYQLKGILSVIAIWLMNNVIAIIVGFFVFLLFYKRFKEIKIEDKKNNTKKNKDENELN